MMAAQAFHIPGPRLVSTCDTPAPSAPSRAAQHLALVPWSPAPEVEPEHGTQFGRREMRLSTFGETKEWKALAADLDAARLRLNAVLPGVLKGRQERDLGIEPATSTDDVRVAEALEAYRQVCVRMFGLKAPRQRHMASLIRAAAEICGVTDPVWSRLNGDVAEGPPINRQLVQVMLESLCHMARLAEDAPKPRHRKAKPVRRRKRV